ncbi:MAG TPA: hypothetical protein VNE39_10750 [Planctomycetota bacterium]|nr:hypothetical protein [Planctomycetota bacterium]
MAKIAAIGRRHFVGVFPAVGAEALRCHTPAEFAEAAARLVAGGAPRLVVLDQHFADCGETIESLRKRGVVVLLLGAERSEGHPALDAIRQLIEVAAGANILGEY